MDEEVLITDGGTGRLELKPGFKHKTIRSLSIAVIVLGALCFTVGGSTSAVALLTKCEYRLDSYQSNYGNRYRSDYRNRYRGWYGYDDPYTSTTTTTAATTTAPHIVQMCQWYRTYTSPGVWFGLTSVVCGIIGLLAAKRKTTCFIVTLMTMSIVSNWAAVCAMTMSIASHFDHGYNEIGSYPISLHVLNAITTVSCLACFVLQWINFGLTCSAVCCDGKKGYPKMEQMSSRRYQYQPVPTQPMAYGSSPMPQPAAPFIPAYNLPYVQHNKQEPVYLVQGHRVLGVVPQNGTPETAPGPSSHQQN